MIMSISPLSLLEYIERLLLNFLPDNIHNSGLNSNLLDIALQRVEKCLGSIHRKYYFYNGVLKFNHLNSDHFATLLYFLGNTIWRELEDDDLPTRLFYLNKIMHGIDLYFTVPMPDIFFLVHPVGTVLGNANYKNYLVVYQNVTVGASRSNIYPTFSEGTVLYSKSSIIGICNLGKNVVLAANTFLLDTNVSDNTIVSGSYPNNKFSKNSLSVQERCFNQTDASHK